MASPALASASASAAAPPAPSSSAPDAPPAVSSPVVVSSSPPALTEPPLHAEDGSLLPQTEDRPSAQSPVYERRVQLLFDAILRDDPSAARSFFFPVEAYEQVKAIEKPGRDWKNRLWRNFERDVHEYHAQLGADPQGATLDRLELREQAARWMKPHSEGNRIGYYRLTRSTIHGRKASGAPIRLELTSMISWRGEWYVVHLHGFR